ncbi:MAG TPA: amidohydrolase family protein [bacterium]|nr:amidohydrolase family protein [bacterium]
MLLHALLAAALLADSTPKPAPRQDSLPLKTTRTISFETTEGTWMSLDVSPDGKTVVFELLGDLYTMPVAGGKATRLTSGPAFDTQPRYSPDGKHIVFLSDRSGGENIWLIDADGAHPKQVTKGDMVLYASPTFTPDGQYIVASRTDGVLGSVYGMWIYHVDGGTGQKLVTDKGGDAPGQSRRPGNTALGAAFGPDGRYVWFSRHRGGFGYNLQYPQWEIATYDRVLGTVATQTDLHGSAMRPVLSPDGRWLVYATRWEAQTGLRLRDLNSGEERWLLYPTTHDDQESRYTRDLMPGSAFTPDSKALLTTNKGHFWRIDIATGQGSEIPFSATVDQQLGPLVKFENRVDTGMVLVKQIRDPRLSPDGKRIAFSALDRVYVMDLPNGAPRRLTADSVIEQVPAWTPDGKGVVYVTWTDAGGHLEKVDVDGKSKPKRLTADAAFYDQPSVSPDGKRVVFIHGTRLTRVNGASAPSYDVSWVGIDGGAITRVIPVSGEGRPHFSRDPGRIYQYFEGEGLVSYRFDGTDRRVHLRVTGYQAPGPDQKPDPAADLVVAPDSAHVLAEVGNNVYEVVLPVIGGDVPAISVLDPMSATFPVKRLTKVGGQFIGWAPDGRSASWSLGRSFFRWWFAQADSALRAKAHADSLRADSVKADTTKGGKPDSAFKARVDSLAKMPAYTAERVDVTVRVARDVPKGTVVLRNARIISMKGDEVIAQGDVIVTDDRIAYVGAVGGGAVPAGAKIIDVSGKTIIPGLVDIHAHPWPIWGVHQTAVWKYLANLAWGVTTTRDPQTATTDVLTYADEVETGALMGPRIYHTGPGVFWDENFKTLDEARNALKRYSEFYGTFTIKEYETGNRKQRQFVIMAAKEQHLMPTTEGGLDFKMNLTEVLDGYPGHEHSYPIFPLYRDAVQLVAQSGITYTPTLLVSYGGPWSENYFYERYDISKMPKVQRFVPHEEIAARAERREWFREDQYVFPQIAASANAIVLAGGKVGLGGHGQMDGLGDHWELWALSAGGMSPMNVLRVGTLFGAQAIGLDHDLGSLEAGKLADLIVLDANPLDDIHNTNTIRYVMKNGRLYEGETLDEVWPRARALPRPWWWGEAPAQ